MYRLITIAICFLAPALVIACSNKKPLLSACPDGNATASCSVHDRNGKALCEAHVHVIVKDGNFGCIEGAPGRDCQTGLSSDAVLCYEQWPCVWKLEFRACVPLADHLETTKIPKVESNCE